MQLISFGFFLRFISLFFYQVDIPIHIIGGETALITFQGIGYDARAMGKSMPKIDQPPEFISVPSTQKVSVPGQVRAVFPNEFLNVRNFSITTVLFRYCFSLKSESVLEIFLCLAKLVTWFF